MGTRLHQSKNFILNIQLFLKRVTSLLHQPVFIALTVFGNLVILTSATVLYHLESQVNPHIQSMIDTIWWATSTVTTVGYGDIVPITPYGKVVGIVTMVIGTALFWSYTALFAEAMLSKEIFDVEIELRSIQKLLEKVEHSDIKNQHETKRLIETLEAQVQNLKRLVH